jgi:hypothetical protein
LPNPRITEATVAKMATHPTKQQQLACDKLAEAVFLLTEAARLDARGSLSATDLDELIARVAKISAVFSQQEIVARALDRRIRALKLSESQAELLTLMESELTSVQMLRKDDDELRVLVAKLEEELGEI